MAEVLDLERDLVAEADERGPSVLAVGAPMMGWRARAVVSGVDGWDVYGARRDREREAASYARVVLQKQMTKHPVHEEGGRVAPGLGFVAGALADGRPS